MKHLIKIESTAHGVLGVRHTGLDQQYCEAGELVIIKWQPDAKWGLQEAHYTDKQGNITPIDLGNGKDVVAFVMPDKDIVVGGTFKRFAVEDWTGRDAAFSIVGSFDVVNLPTLDGFEDAGKVAFVKDTRKYATWDGYGWTYMDGTPVTPRYLKFTSNDNGSSVLFYRHVKKIDPLKQAPKFEYSTDGGDTWQQYTIGDGDTAHEAESTIVSLDKGDSVMFRGTNEIISENSAVYINCSLEGRVAASGDITSLLNGVGGDATLTAYCYTNMFQGCSALTSAPVLPATTLANYCYSGMFQGCTSLTVAPALPATMLANSCYASMFQGCSALTSAPVLPATTLANNCYQNMFSSCSDIISHDVATLNNSTNTFQNNASCASFTIHADTPPTIANTTISGLKADCIIYVPAASVDAYKAAQYWSARADYIQAMP